MAKLRSAKQRKAPTRYSPDPPSQQSKATNKTKKTTPKAISNKAKKAPPPKKKGRKPAASKAKKPAVEATKAPPPQKKKERNTKDSQGLRTSPAPTEAEPSNASPARAPSAHSPARGTSRPPSLSLAPSRRSLSTQPPIKREMKSKSPEVGLEGGRSSAPSPEPC
ncbi:MAG: hypothetical protein Q9164_003451 [Protoblastenia rupestris]